MLAPWSTQLSNESISDISRKQLSLGLVTAEQHVTFDRDFWQRTRLLFDELVELDPDERSSRLKQMDAEDPALRQALERLLLADAGPEAEAAPE